MCDSVLPWQPLASFHTQRYFLVTKRGDQFATMAEATTSPTTAARGPRSVCTVVLGVLLLLGVDVIWVGSSFFIKYVIFGDVLNITNGNVSTDGYHIPYFLTYLGNSLFIVYLPLMGCRQLVINVQRGFLADAKEKLLAQPVACSLQTSVATNGSDVDDVGESQALDDVPPAPRCSVLRRTVKWALIVCPFWFAANCTYNISQGLTSVTSSTILSSTSGACGCVCLCAWEYSSFCTLAASTSSELKRLVDSSYCRRHVCVLCLALWPGLFTFVLGFFFTNESFTFVKLLGILLSLAGGAIVALHDSDESGDDLSELLFRAKQRIVRCPHRVDLTLLALSPYAYDVCCHIQPLVLSLSVDHEYVHAYAACFGSRRLGMSAGGSPLRLLHHPDRSWVTKRRPVPGMYVLKRVCNDCTNTTAM
jgi:drug/metabolite transporter (DMT)-like permease